MTLDLSLGSARRLPVALGTTAAGAPNFWRLVGRGSHETKLPCLASPPLSASRGVYAEWKKLRRRSGRDDMRSPRFRGSRALVSVWDSLRVCHLSPAVPCGNQVRECLFDGRSIVRRLTLFVSSLRHTDRPQVRAWGFLISVATSDLPRRAGETLLDPRDGGDRVSSAHVAPPVTPPVPPSRRPGMLVLRCIEYTRCRPRLLSAHPPVTHPLVGFPDAGGLSVSGYGRCSFRDPHAPSGAGAGCLLSLRVLDGACEGFLFWSGGFDLVVFLLRNLGERLWLEQGRT